MPTFGFSAFLKLLSLNDRPQRTALRGRLRPSTGGYDYHRSLKLRASRYLVDGREIADVISSCADITKSDEQHSARTGLENLADWRDENPGPTFIVESRLFESPGGLFKVHFTPDFGLEIGARRTATHIYNTRQLLAPRMVYSTLSLFPDLYEEDESAPEDLAVLSLREGRLYRLSEAAADHPLLAARVVAALDETIREIRDDLGLPPLPPSGPQPPNP